MEASCENPASNQVSLQKLKIFCGFDWNRQLLIVLLASELDWIFSFLGLLYFLELIGF